VSTTTSETSCPKCDFRLCLGFKQPKTVAKTKGDGGRGSLAERVDTGGVVPGGVTLRRFKKKDRSLQEGDLGSRPGHEFTPRRGTPNRARCTETLLNEREGEQRKANVTIVPDGDRRRPD
jgi:hypothetical protein